MSNYEQEIRRQRDEELRRIEEQRRREQLEREKSKQRKGIGSGDRPKKNNR